MNNQKDNMKLWSQVETTNPEYTKKAKKGAHHFTSITPMSQFKAATQAFGIQGIHWGIKIGSEVFTEHDIGETKLLDYDAILFFTFEGEKGEIPVHATEKLSYKTQGASGYLKIDDEARKKVVTNAKTKGLSELGFNADIFMGLFDDQDYINTLQIESQIEKAEDKDNEVTKQVAKLKEEIEATCKSIGLESTKLNAATSMHNKFAVTLQRKRSLINLQPCADWGLNQIGFALKKKTEESK